MDAFLEDGSHEATTAVIRSLVIAVPHTTDKLRDYILKLLCSEIKVEYQNSFECTKIDLSFS